MVTQARAQGEALEVRRTFAASPQRVFDAWTRPEALKQWANARLGRMQRISEVRVVETLPRSSAGKVLKRSLREGL